MKKSFLYSLPILLILLSLTSNIFAAPLLTNTKVEQPKLVETYGRVTYGLIKSNSSYGREEKKPILSNYGYATNISSTLEKRIAEWKKNAAKQIEQIDKEIQKLQDRKTKINKDLEEKILAELNKTNNSYGVKSNEIVNISYTISNGYSGMSYVFNINKEGGMKITEHNKLDNNTNTVTKTGKLTAEEFTNLKNIIIKANVFTLEDRYECKELCPTDTSDGIFTFTIGNNTKTITTTVAVNLPEGLSNIKAELIRLKNKLSEENTSYGASQIKKETLINKAINKVKSIFSK